MPGVWLYVTVDTVIVSFVHAGTILCSQCHTKEDPKCEQDPPAPKPCFDPGDGIPQTCSIIRTFYAGQCMGFGPSIQLLLLLLSDQLHLCEDGGFKTYS